MLMECCEKKDVMLLMISKSPYIFVVKTAAYIKAEILQNSQASYVMRHRNTIKGNTEQWVVRMECFMTKNVLQF